MEGVATHHVPLRQNALDEVRIPHHVDSYTEKGGMRLEVRQRVEHPRCHLRYGAVIESEIQHRLVGIHAPMKGGKHILDESGHFGQIHSASLFFGVM